MLIEDIPYHLRNTITVLAAPIYVELRPDHCHPPSNMALVGLGWRWYSSDPPLPG